MRLIVRSLGLLALATSVQATTPFIDPRFDVRETRGVVFATGRVAAGSQALMLDIYEPSGAEAPRLRPAFIAIHSGGPELGWRRSAPLVQLCSELAARGFVCVSIDYRQQPSRPIVGASYQRLLDDLGGPGSARGGRVVSAVEDANRAFEWLVAHAAALGVDPARIAIGGASTGASAALCLAYAQDDSGLPSRRIGLVVDLWGTLYDQTARIEPGEPPLLVVHGELDTTVPFHHAEALARGAWSAGVEVDFLPIEGARHGFASIPIFTPLDDDDDGDGDGNTVLQRIVVDLFEALDLASLPSRAAPFVEPGSYRLEAQWDGTTRSALLHIPSRYGAAEGLPLLLGLHGGYDSASGFAARGRWLAKAEAEGFIAVFPEGTAAVQTWNATHCCGDAFARREDDSGFLRALLDRLRATLKVDAARIYVTGHSNGAMMAHRLAAEHAEIIAALAPVGGTIGGVPFRDGPYLTPVTPRHPVPTMVLHGLLDSNVPFAGGQGSGPGAAIGRIDASALASFEFWARVNRARSIVDERSPDGALVSIVAEGGAGFSQTRLDVVLEGNHEWAGATSDASASSVDATELVWSFLSRQRKSDPRP